MPVLYCVSGVDANDSVSALLVLLLRRVDMQLPVSCLFLTLIAGYTGRQFLWIRLFLSLPPLDLPCPSTGFPLLPLDHACCLCVYLPSLPTMPTTTTTCLHLPSVLLPSSCSFHHLFPHSMFWGERLHWQTGSRTALPLRAYRQPHYRAPTALPLEFRGDTRGTRVRTHHTAPPAADYAQYRRTAG